MSNEQAQLIITILSFIVGGLVVITILLARMLSAVRSVHHMIHDHIHGITNYLAEAVGELRVMRACSNADEEEITHDHDEHTHGHHHN
jgi:fumarate reductase subunit D